MGAKSDFAAPQQTLDVLLLKLMFQSSSGNVQRPLCEAADAWNCNVRASQIVLSM